MNEIKYYNEKFRQCDSRKKSKIYGYGNNTKIQFDNFLQLSEGSETIEIAANKLKKSRVEFSKFEMGGPK